VNRRNFIGLLGGTALTGSSGCLNSVARDLNGFEDGERVVFNSDSDQYQIDDTLWLYEEHDEESAVFRYLNGDNDYLEENIGENDQPGLEQVELEYGTHKDIPSTPDFTLQKTGESVEMMLAEEVEYKELNTDL
jgi:hypothetical protein